MSEQPARIEGIPAGLTVRGPDVGGPVADWLCACGHHERATGRRDVEHLVARVRVGHCPHPAEGRAAA